MSESDTQQPRPAHRPRRATIALNVGASILLALALAALVNWLGYRHFASVDLTASRRYSLSPQTRRIITGLEDDYRIVTLLAAPDAREAPVLAANIQAARDLLDEYDRRSPRIRVEHLDPARNMPRIDELFVDIRSRFGDQLLPIDEHLHELFADFTAVRDALSAQGDAFKAVMVHRELRDAEFAAFVRSASTTIDRLEAQAADASMLDGDLPNYQLALDSLRAQARAVHQALNTIADRFERQATLPSTADNLRNDLLLLIRALEKPRSVLAELNDALAQVRVPEAYQKLHEALGKPNAIVLLGAGEVRTVHLTDLLAAATVEDATDAGRYLFLGEEKITGTLVGMASMQPPLVVFVTPGPWPAYGTGGEYDHIAERLRKMSFEVTQWTPALRNRSTGAPMPTAAEPKPKEGQRVVWVLQMRTLQHQATPSLDSPKSRIITTIRDRVAQGDRAMIVLGPEPETPTDPEDPLMRWLADWDIRPLLEQAAAHEVPIGDRQTVGTYQFDIDRWPSDTPMSAVLKGMVGHVTIAAPLIVGDGVRVGARLWPLIELTEPRMWAETTFETRYPVYDEPAARERIVIAAAGERGDERIVVLTDPTWPSDRLVKAGIVDPQSQQLLIARFPANAEFFMNSIYWLAGREELIAISARLQDIRRIQPMDAARQRTVQAVLMIGMPLLPILAGAAVWLVRRRG